MNRLHLTERENSFYRDYYDSVMVIVIVAMFAALCSAVFAFYQLFHRPLPSFSAVAANGKQMQLVASPDPNLTSSAIIKWSRKAALAAYTFDFVNYTNQLRLAKPYFTVNGWDGYLASISPLIATIKQNQLFINSIITDPPVISNQGELPEQGYVWRIQIPFLVTFQSAETVTRKNYTVLLTIEKVPTTVNPAGIGISQFVMK